jgi:hypothetical protein
MPSTCCNFRLTGPFGITLRAGCAMDGAVGLIPHLSGFFWGDGGSYNCSSPRSWPFAASPLPTRPADPTGSTATSLATAIGATAGDKHVRRPSASALVAAGGRSLSSTTAPDLRCVRGLPGAGLRECMPMAQATTIRPNRHPEATKPQLSPLRGGRCCGLGGLLAVLTAILA